MTILRKPTTLVVLAVVLIVGIMLYMSTGSYLRRKAEMLEFMRQESILLIHSLELAFHNTILANGEIEQFIAQRLFDIAMMIDRNLLSG